MDATLEEHIGFISVLLLDKLTPLLRSEIHHLLVLGKQSDSTLEVTDALSKINAHWAKIYGTPFSKARLVKNMVQLRDQLVHRLLEIYAKKTHAYTDTDKLRIALVLGSNCIDSGTDLLTVEEPMHTYVVTPVEELMLDRRHVEWRLGTTGQLGIQGNEGSDLEKTLADDRKLVTELFAENWFLAYNEYDKETILQGIDSVEKMYCKPGTSSFCTTFVRFLPFFSKESYESEAQKELLGDDIA